MAGSGENIDLGSFQWDLTALEKQINDNKRAIQGFSEVLKLNKDLLKSQSKEIQETAKTIAACRVAQGELNKQFEEGTINQEDYEAATQALNQQIEESERATEGLAQAQSELIQTNTRLNNSMRDLNEENRSLTTLMRGGRTEAVDNATAYRDLNKELNALKLEAKNLGAELVIMERNGDNSSEAYQELRARWEAASAAANELNDRFKELDSAVGDNQRNVGAYAEGFKSAFEEITSGNIREGIDKLKASFKDIIPTLKSFFATLLANPWLVLVGGLALYIKELIEHNKYIAEANQEVEMLTNSTGELTNELRRSAQAIADTFQEKDFNTAVRELDSLMKDFGLSSKEAFDLYAAGLAQGGAMNDEFGESIREYGQLFAQNGFSAQQFISILNKGIDLGIYSDKLPDALKEAGIAINEQTKATRDALVNAFGAPFSDDILKRVRFGQVTVSGALNEIADKAEEAGLNQQQLAQLTADLFKGAGEDAGGALVIFDVLNATQKETEENLTDLEKATVNLVKANYDLQVAKDAAFDNKSVRALKRDTELLWISIKTKSYEALAALSDFVEGAFNGLRLNVANSVTILASIPLGVRKIITAVATDFLNLGKIASTTGKIIKDAFTLDTEGVAANYKSLQDQIKNFNSSTIATFGRIDDYIDKVNTNNFKTIAAQQKAKADAVKAEEEAQKRLSESKLLEAQAKADADKAATKAKAEADKAAAKAKSTADKAVRDAEKAVKDADKAREEAAKQAVEIEKERAAQSIDIAKNELAEYIRINADKYKDDKRLTQAKLQDQLNYFDEVARRQIAANALEKKSAQDAVNAKVEEIERKGKLNSQDEEQIRTLKANLEVINLEYAEKDAALEQSALDNKKALNKKYLDDVRDQKNLHLAIQYQEAILALEAQGGKEFEIMTLQEDQRFQEQLRRFAEENQVKLDMDANNYITRQEIQAERDLLEAEYNSLKDENERERIKNQLDALNQLSAESAQREIEINKAKEEAKLQGLSQAFGMAKTLFKENTFAYKAMAIAEATISTYLSATKALAEVPWPINYVVMGANIAAGLAQVVKIAGVKGFSGGGYTGDGGKFTPAGTVHKGEVVWSQADVRAVGGPAAADSMRPTYGGYFNGGAVGISTLSSVQNVINSSATTMAIDQAAIDAIAGAIYSGSQRGIGDMADNSSIRRGASFG